MEFLIVLIVGSVVGIGIYFGRRFYVNNKILSSTIPTINKIVSSTKSSFSNAEEKNINNAYREWVDLYNAIAELNTKISFYKKQIEAAEKIWKKNISQELSLKVAECEKEKAGLDTKFKKAAYSFSRVSSVFNVSEIRNAFEKIYHSSNAEFFSPFFAGRRHFIEQVGKDYWIFLPCYVVVLDTGKGCLSIYTYDTISTEYGTTTEQVYATAYDDELYSVHWLHERVSGGPDLRYSYNPKTTYVWRGKVTIKIGYSSKETKFSNRAKAREYQEKFDTIISLFKGAYGLSIKALIKSANEEMSFTEMVNENVRKEKEQKQRELQIQQEKQEKESLIKSLNIAKGVITRYSGKAKKLIIPKGIATSIADWAFSSFGKDLESITIPEGIVSVGKYAFYGCSKLTSVVMPNSVTEIGSSAFDGCTSLKSIIIPNGVTKIAYSTFKGCSSLKSITIPNNLTEIENFVFDGCSSLENIYISNLSTWCKLNLGDGDWVRYQAKKLYLNNELITEVKIPDGVKSLNGTFAGIQHIESVVIPDSVNYLIGTFENCKKLKAVHIGKGVTHIDGVTFSGCESLEEVIIPENVTEISCEAFSNCSNLQSITILSENISIDKDVFAGCESIKKLVTKSKNVWRWGAAFSSCFNLSEIVGLDDLSWSDKQYFKDTPWLESQAIDGLIVVENVLYAYCGCDKEYTVSDEIIEIGDGAFENNNVIEKVILPDGLNKIGKRAFAFCANLKSIMIPESVTEIDDNAFFGSRNVCIKCYRGSCASNFRAKHKIPVEYISKQAERTTEGVSRRRTSNDGLSGLSDEEKRMIFNMRQERERKEKEEAQKIKLDETNRTISEVGNSPVEDCDEKRVLTNNIVQRWYKQTSESSLTEYNLYFIDELGDRISNTVVLKLSTAEEKTKVTFELSAVNGFDNSKTYYLLVCDMDNKILGKIPYKINITFVNDFDF